MTTDTAAAHPLTNAGYGRGPFKVWTAIRLPLRELAATDRAVAGRRQDRIVCEAALFHVPATDRCGICKQPQDDLYVVCNSEEQSVGTFCQGCIYATDDTALILKMKHLDREFNRHLTRVAPRRSRR